MKTFSAMATASFLTMISANPVLASDLGSGGQDSAAQYAPAMDKFSWTGFYLGGRIGYGNANHEISVDQYYKDFCTLDDPARDGYDGFDDYYRPYTVGNINSYYGTSFSSCSEIDTSEDEGVQGANTSGGKSREVASLDGLNSSGITGGLQIGYDQQIGNRFVVGVFGSYDLSSMNTTATVSDVTMTLIEKGDEWSIGARAGYLLHPRVMAYVLAAYTQADWEFIGDQRKDITFDGLTIGGGLEYALSRNVFLGVEGTHTFYGKETVFDVYDPDYNNGIRVNDEIGETKILGTLKVKLNGDLLN